VRRIVEGLQSIAVTAWVGALWTTGLLVDPALFHFVPDRVLFGNLIGRLFAYTALLGIGCGAYLLLFGVLRFGSRCMRQAFFWVTLAMLALTLVEAFAVQPIVDAVRQQAFPKPVAETMLRERFAAWHGIASLLYVIQCALGLALVLWQPRTPH